MDSGGSGDEGDGGGGLDFQSTSTNNTTTTTTTTTKTVASKDFKDDITIKENEYLTPEVKKEKLAIGLKLHQFARAGIVRGVLKCIQDGAYVDYSSCGNTALSLATFYGHNDVIRWLVQIGEANVNLVTTMHQTSPLGIAIKQGFLNTVKLIIALGGDPQLKDMAGVTMIHHAIIGGDVEIVKALIDTDEIDLDQSIDENDNTLLHEAATKSNRDVVQYVVEAGISLLKVNNQGRTALHRAIQANNTPVIEYLSTKHDLLDIQDNHGYSALLLAAFNGKKDYVQTLIDAGADATLIRYVDAKDCADIANEKGYRDLCVYICDKIGKTVPEVFKPIVDFTPTTPSKQQPKGKLSQKIKKEMEKEKKEGEKEDDEEVDEKTKKRLSKVKKLNFSKMKLRDTQEGEGEGEGIGGDGIEPIVMATEFPDVDSTYKFNRKKKKQPTTPKTKKVTKKKQPKDKDDVGDDNQEEGDEEGGEKKKKTTPKKKATPKKRAKKKADLDGDLDENGNNITPTTITTSDHDNDDDDDSTTSKKKSITRKKSVTPKKKTAPKKPKHIPRMKKEPKIREESDLVNSNTDTDTDTELEDIDDHDGIQSFRVVVNDQSDEELQREVERQFGAVTARTRKLLHQNELEREKKSKAATPTKPVAKKPFAKKRPTRKYVKSTWTSAPSSDSNHSSSDSSDSSDDDHSISLGSSDSSEVESTSSSSSSPPTPPRGYKSKPKAFAKKKSAAGYRMVTRRQLAEVDEDDGDVPNITPSKRKINQEEEAFIASMKLSSTPKMSPLTTSMKSLFATPHTPAIPFSLNNSRQDTINNNNNNNNNNNKEDTSMNIDQTPIKPILSSIGSITGQYSPLPTPSPFKKNAGGAAASTDDYFSTPYKNLFVSKVIDNDNDNNNNNNNNNNNSTNNEEKNNEVDIEVITSTTTTTNNGSDNINTNDEQDTTSSLDTSGDISDSSKQKKKRRKKKT